MKNREQAKLALITAGARRLGRHLALGLAKAGFNIALHFNRSEEEASAAVAEIRQLGRQAEAFSMDLCQGNAGAELIELVNKQMGKPDLLVNNASIWKPKNFLDSTEEVLEENLAIHLKAPYFLSQALASSKGGGHIVNILDAAVQSNKTKFFPYLLAKKSLLNLTEMLAIELAPTFRVNAIAPGCTLPPEGVAKEVWTDNFTANPLQHQLSPPEILRALLFLEDSPHLTGQCIHMDGGTGKL